MAVLHVPIHKGQEQPAQSAQEMPTKPAAAPALPGGRVFKLFYALALAGRFQYEVSRFLACLCADGGAAAAATTTAAALESGSLLAQGFFHVSTQGDSLDARVDRVWVAARTFILRGMILTGRGRPIHTNGGGAKEANDTKNTNLHTDLSRIPSLLPATVSVLDGSKTESNSHDYSEQYLWACAGVILGARCHDTVDWKVDRMSLQDIAAIVFRLEDEESHRGQDTCNDEADKTGKAGLSGKGPSLSRPNKRVWAPVMPGPASHLVVHLYRRLDFKEQQNRILRQQLIGLDSTK